MLDRTKTPRLQTVKKLLITEPQKITLKNGIPVYFLDNVSQDVAYIKLVFDAGRWQEPQKLVARLTNRMLKEGTRSHSATELANTIEYYGAALKTQITDDVGEVSLHSLTKHLPKLLPILKEILTEATFPEKEFKSIIRRNKQRLLVDMQKNDFVADLRFTELLFGSKHPYGYPVTIEDYDNITTATLQQFYSQRYTANCCKIYIAGKLNSTDMQLIEQYLGGKDWLSTKKVNNIKHSSLIYSPKTDNISIPNSVQASIRLGMPFVSKNDPSFAGLYVLNTIFGGFFGSRLMHNIREEKGYTYGIYSYITSQLHGNYFTIASEVGADVAQLAINEIFNEIYRLHKKPVSKVELKLVQNYLLGRAMNAIDGAFNLIHTLQNIYDFNLNIDYFYNFINTVKTITPQQLQQLSEQYLIPQNITQVTVGK